MVHPLWDIYFPNFAEWCGKYHRSGNPLFIPEAIRDSVIPFYAFGQCDAMGFSPFAIDDSTPPRVAGEPPSPQADFRQCYSVLSGLAPLILENQGKGKMVGVLLDETNQTQKIQLDGYTLKVSHDYTWGGSRNLHPSPWPRRGQRTCLTPHSRGWSAVASRCSRRVWRTWRPCSSRRRWPTPEASAWWCPLRTPRTCSTGSAQ